VNHLWRNLFLLLVLAALVALAGCNTVRGFGKDLEQLGKGIQGD
jgi:predicted small secreted protein